MRCPHLRPYAYIAHWWTEDIENYGDAVRFRDKLCAEGGNKMLLETSKSAFSLRRSCSPILTLRTSPCRDEFSPQPAAMSV
ncbi:hypothetical protein J2W42_002029 [Rhizobium tibeticum]|nr:hypothetical protein [Rhizobium tibeticum]